MFLQPNICKPDPLKEKKYSNRTGLFSVEEPGRRMGKIKEKVKAVNGRTIPLQSKIVFQSQSKEILPSLPKLKPIIALVQIHSRTLNCQ